MHRNRSRAKGGHDSATSQSDVRKSTERAKQENPEAPVTIGMQDERGGKGSA